MPVKIRDTAEFAFIENTVSGVVHIEIRYASYDNPYQTDERVSFADGMHSMLYGPHVVLCGAKTYPVAEKTHCYTDCFPDEKLCQQCHRRLHPNDIERAFRHPQPGDPKES